MNPNNIREILEPILDPDLHKSLGELGSVADVRVEGAQVAVYLDIVQPVFGVARRINHDVTQAVLANYPSAEVTVYVREKGLPISQRPPSLSEVKNLIAVASGKGGVGKSTVAANLAARLAQRGLLVGLLDADVYGPSQPTMFGVAGEGMRAEKGEDGKIIGYPNEQYGVKIASLGFVMQRDQAAILRGPMLAGYFTTLVEQIQWGELDVLLFDLPPGTGDIQLTLTQRIPLTGAVIVTTPQEIALADVRRSIQMFRKVNVHILGIVENMSYFSPPDMPEKRYPIFGSGGGQSVASEYGVPLLGEIPIDPRVCEGADTGMPIVLDPDAGVSGEAFNTVTDQLLAAIRGVNASAVASSVEITL